MGRKHYSAAPEAYSSRRTAESTLGSERVDGIGPDPDYAARLSNRIPAATAIAESTR